MNVTSSPGSRDSDSWTRAIVRIRRTDSDTAAFASGFVSRRACRRSSDEIVCRLFFTRWWISRIVASLLSSSRSRLRSSVTSRTSSTPPATSSAGRGSARSGTAASTSAPCSNSSTTGTLVLVGLAHRVVVEAELGEAHPDGVGVDADAVQRRVGVRRQVADPRRRRRGSSRRRRPAARRSSRRPRPGYGNVPSAIIAGEAVEDRHVRALELARRRARPARPTRGSARRSCRRRRSAPGWPASAPSRAAPRPSTSPSVISPDVNAEVEHRLLGHVGERADPVGVVHGLAGRRADLADDQPALVLRRHVQQQVGEAEVGEHAPLGRQPVEVRHLVAIERRVVPDECGE